MLHFCILNLTTMKKYMILLTVLMLSAFTMNATTPVYDGEEGDPEVIDLGQQHNGEDPTGIQTLGITAYKTGTSIVITFINYSGYANASALGLSGNVFSGQQYISGTGLIILDISSLPQGNYSLFVQAGNLYCGSFTI